MIFAAKPTAMTTDPAGADALGVELVYALPEHYWSIRLRLPAGATVADALSKAEVALREAGVQADPERMAVHSRPVFPSTPLRDGDRLELLRPLLADPKQSRRERASASSPKR